MFRRKIFLQSSGFFRAAEQALGEGRRSCHLSRLLGKAFSYFIYLFIEGPLPVITIIVFELLDSKGLCRVLVSWRPAMR